MSRYLLLGIVLAGMLLIGMASASMQVTAVPFLNTQTPGIESFDDSPAVTAVTWSGNLTSVEIEDLKAQQDAEMFQRDAYRVLSATYLNMPMFDTMAESADILLNYGNRLLPGYGSLDPGTYSRGDLRQLFSRYVGTTGPSSSDGLVTAATTEDMHIAGLVLAMSRTSNPELRDLYSLELAVARNNLRMIGRNLGLRGIAYTPQYLDESTYAAIMNGPFEQVRLPDRQQMTSATAAGIAPPEMTSFQEAIPGTPAGALTEAEIEDVLFFQEMEQFDRDLFSALAAEHPGILLFASLARAAEAEMDADNVILKRYNINYTPMERGVFRNENLRHGFRDFMTNSTGLASDALATAAESEDWHIAYLTNAMRRTTHADILFIYNEQLALSRNSLREIDRELRARGGTYAPRYITDEYYNAIIGSPVEPR